MEDVFRDQHHAARARAGAPAVLVLWLRMLPSFLIAALLERRASRHPAPKRQGLLEMLGTFVSDLRYGLRQLRKAPVFALVAVLVISLGSGAVTTIFSAMNALVLRTLPGSTDGNQLIGIQRRTEDGSGGISASYHFYRQVQEASTTLNDVAVWSKVTLSLSTGGEGQPASGNLVSGNYFEVLGVRPALGRFFLPAEDATPLTHPVVVLSHAFWSGRLAGDSGVVGRAVQVNGQPYTVIGVAPAGFQGVFTPIVTDAWLPLMMQPHLRPFRRLDDTPWLWMFGRVKPGVSREAAAGELNALTARHIEATGHDERFTHVEVVPLNGLPADASRAAAGFIALLLGASALVMLIAGVNVASMLSARAIARRKEMALRTALGAWRGRLIRQLLTETLLLFLAGAAGGAVLAVLATRALERIPIPTDVPMLLELSPDPMVFGVTLLVSLLAGVLFGVGPAFSAAEVDITTRLREDSSGGGRRRRFGNLLVTGQLALSLVLLVAAGLFLRALQRGSTIAPGFEPAGVATAALNTESFGYDAVRGRAFYQELRQRLEGQVGVEVVSFTAWLPLTFATSNGQVEVDGVEAPIQLGNVDAGYFELLRLPILSGRALDATDVTGSPPVAVVNETLARRFWPGGDAVGRSFLRRGERIQVVGVARDAKYEFLGEETPAFAYFPLAQQWQPVQSLMVRGAGDPAALVGTIQEAVLAIDPTLPRVRVVSLVEANAIVLWPQKVAAIVTAMLGGTGLLLAAVGLYGLIAWSVSRRTREIGIRMALGAHRTTVQGMIVREGMRLAGWGVALGLVLAAAATRLLASLLFDVSAWDPLTFGGMSLLFAGVAILASWLPARRASRSDPMLVLRGD
jgi:predicted permease